MIYTSYFKAAAQAPNTVSIYPKPPAWFVGGIAEDIVPDDEMYRKIKRNEMTKKQFADYYLGDVLMQKDPAALAAEYDGKTLVGWSADDPYDCRFIFSQFMNYYIGGSVRELTKREIELGIRMD